MAVDATMRKLTIPPRFMPYLERHRIYDLFYELGNLLGANMPEDHVLFLRNTLAQMNETRNRPRLLLLAPPFMDKKKIMDILAVKTGQVVLSRFELVTDPMITDANELAGIFQSYITENDIQKKGWILHDYPSSNEEAKAMLLGGIVPTHTLLFIPLSKTKTSKHLWLDNLDQWTTTEIKDTWNKYQRTIRDFRHTFRETFMEVNILCKTLDEIMDECTKLLKEFPMRGPPMTPRVVLIGTRGSRRGQIAKLLHERVGLIPVDMSEIIEEAKLGDTEIAEQIRFLDSKKVPLYASIILKLLQDRLLREDCLSKGWVLIRFPRDKADLLAIDAFDTPPNRIIFLSMNNSEAFKRLRDIRIHIRTGYMGSKSAIDERGIYHEEDNYFIHPSDDEKRILLDHERFSSAYQDMVDYCGEDCAIVNADGKLEQVVERIESVIGKGTGHGEPRPGSLKHRPFCSQDTWGYAQGEEQQEDISPVTSNTYLFRNVFHRAPKNKCIPPRDTYIPSSRSSYTSDTTIIARSCFPDFIVEEEEEPVQLLPFNTSRKSRSNSTDQSETNSKSAMSSKSIPSQSNEISTGLLYVEQPSTISTDNSKISKSKSY